MSYFFRIPGVCVVVDLHQAGSQVMVCLVDCLVDVDSVNGNHNIITRTKKYIQITHSMVSMDRTSLYKHISLYTSMELNFMVNITMPW